MRHLKREPRELCESARARFGNYSGKGKLLDWCPYHLVALHDISFAQHFQGNRRVGLNVIRDLDPAEGPGPKRFSYVEVGYVIAIESRSHFSGRLLHTFRLQSRVRSTLSLHLLRGTTRPCESDPFLLFSLTTTKCPFHKMVACLSKFEFLLDPPSKG